MDRRNGGDPLAPPRPPKSLPRVHNRPRAPEPSMMSSATTAAAVAANPIPPQLSPKPNHLNATQTTTTTLLTSASNIRNQLQLARHPSFVSTTSSSSLLVAPAQQQQQQHQQPPPPLLQAAPTTAPLTPLQSRNPNLSSSNISNISSASGTTFSRRRPPVTLPTTTPLATIPTLSSTIQNLEVSPSSPVTLAAPRPENERLTNEYVDTPFSRTTAQTGSGRTFLLSAQHQPNVGGGRHNQHAGLTNIGGTPTTTTTSAAANHLLGYNALGKPVGSTATTTAAGTPPTTRGFSSSNFSSNRHNNNRPNVLPVQAITKQPVSFSKDLPAMALHDADIDLHPTNGDSLNSIKCPQCQRCRCEECQRPRQLPSRWICDNSCLCSAETIIDYASCLCCVKALYYHCSKDHEMERDSDTISCADDPCSCLPHKRITRWGCLGALSLVLPCLLCYWPMRGCVSLCAKCYAKSTRHGCRCPQSKTPSGRSNNILSSSIRNTTTFQACDQTPEKRLLDSSPEY